MKRKMKQLLSVLLAVLLLAVQTTVSFGAEGAEDVSEKNIQSWTGWIVDRDCVGADVVKHSKGCDLMGVNSNPPDSCYGSGLGLAVYVPGKAVTEYKSNTYPDYLVFDEEGREIAKNFLYSLPSDWIRNLSVKVTGYVVEKIPANDNESRVPETDVSKVSKYLKGIHVISIETASIDGLSTNALPSPNLVINADSPKASPPAVSSMGSMTNHSSGTESTSAGTSSATAAHGTDTGIKVLLNGKELQFDVPPTVVHGKTLFPLRKITESLGAKVEWDNASKTVTVVKGEITVKLKEGQNSYSVNGSRKTSDTAFSAVRGRLLVPQAVLEESLGAVIHFDSTKKTYSIEGGK